MDNNSTNVKKLGKKRIFQIISLFAFVVLIVLFIESSVMEVTHYEINSRSSHNINADGIRIALIADLHCTEYGENQQKLVSRIREGKPDLILLAGDIFHHFGDREPGLALIREAVEVAPVYYVSGNHEWANPEESLLIDEVTENGGIVLEDEFVELEINGNPIILAGAKHWRFKELRNRDELKILLTHYPHDYSEHSHYFDLMLTGHAHGGQVRVPLLFPNGLYAPGQGVLPKYTGGLYEHDNDFTLIVSKGLSKKYEAMFRILNRPELVFVTIT
jgi:hypothetical protein